MPTRAKASIRRDGIREEYWPKGDDYWKGHDEVGWFAAPRTLPLILSLLRSKTISDNRNPGPVYLELLSRQKGEGVIEIVHELDHAYAAGYEGTRALRSWQDQIKILKDNNFIKVARVGNRDRYILITHPTVVIEGLRKNGKISDQWWTAYNDLKRETKEPTFQQRIDKKNKDEKEAKERAEQLKKRAEREAKAHAEFIKSTQEAKSKERAAALKAKKPSKKAKKNPSSKKK